MLLGKCILSSLGLNLKSSFHHFFFSFRLSIRAGLLIKDLCLLQWLIYHTAQGSTELRQGFVMTGLLHGGLSQTFLPQRKGSASQEKLLSNTDASHALLALGTTYIEPKPCSQFFGNLSGPSSRSFLADGAAGAAQASASL